MHCFKKWLSINVILMICCFASNVAFAQGIQGKTVQLVSSAQPDEPLKIKSWDLQATFDVTLPARLIELAKATPIYFVLNWNMTRPRWYWRDERLTQGQIFWRLSYNPITQEWRISSANTPTSTDARFSISYPSLTEALAPLTRIRRENLIAPEILKPNEEYEISVRLRLDTSLLPKPFQINAITNKDWALDSGQIINSFIAQSAVNAFIPITPAIR